MSGLGWEARRGLAYPSWAKPGAASLRGSSRRPGNIPKEGQQDSLVTQIHEWPQGSTIRGGRRTNSEAPWEMPVFSQMNSWEFKSREFSPAELEAKQMLSLARRPLLCDYYFHVPNFQLSGACQWWMLWQKTPQSCRQLKAHRDVILFLYSSKSLLFR